MSYHFKAISFITVSTSELSRQLKQQSDVQNMFTALNQQEVTDVSFFLLQMGNVSDYLAQLVCASVDSPLLIHWGGCICPKHAAPEHRQKLHSGQQMHESKPSAVVTLN